MKKNNFEFKTVPNQRIITIHKEPTDNKHLYTTNNLEAIEQAVNDLQSQIGIKLYLYFAKNQNNFTMALSSNDFFEWANCGKTAYNTAFKELEEKGYLIPKGDSKTNYIFYDKPQEQKDIEEYNQQILEQRELANKYREEEKQGFTF